MGSWWHGSLFRISWMFFLGCSIWGNPETDPGSVEIDISAPKPVDPDFGVETVLDRYFAANQGRSQIQKIQSIRLAGTVEEGKSSVPFTLIKKRPNRAHLTYHFEGYEIFTIYDGEKVSRVLKSEEQIKILELNSAEKAKFIRDARFNSILVEYSDRFQEIQLIGEAEIRGLPCYQIQIEGKEGPIQVYVDQLKYRVLREDYDTAEGAFSFSYGKYETLNGVWFPYEIKVQNLAGSYVLNIETIELNIGLFDSFFSDLP